MGHRGYGRKPRESLAAIFASALTGAAATVAVFMIAMVASTPQSLAGPDIGLLVVGLLWLLYVFVGCLIVWWVGLLLLGAPAWFILHRLGFSGPITAMAAGSVLTSSAFLGFFVVLGAGAEPLRGTLILIALFGLLTGVPAGFSLWRVAYRRTDAGADAS